MTRKTDPVSAYKCTCGKRFEAFAELREHHTRCLKFIAQKDGYEPMRKAIQARRKDANSIKGLASDKKGE